MVEEIEAVRNIVVYPTESKDEIEKEIKTLKEFYSSPSKMGKEVVAEVAQENDEEAEDKSSDNEYMPGDAGTSDANEEAYDILKKFRRLKRQMKNGQAADLDDVVLDGFTRNTTGSVGIEIDDDGNGTPYDDSSDEEMSSEEVDSEGNVRKMNDGYLRFNKKNAMPIFSLGMKFSGKKQFKKAIIKYDLAEKKVINFVKDELGRVRTKCDWAGCPWVCLLSTNSRIDSWQIATLRDEHACPPRRDNKHATSRRIAKKYEKFIMANLMWKLSSMKTTIQEDMFADVSLSKLKRSKSIVMQKSLDATKGQYQRMYDY